MSWRSLALATVLSLAALGCRPILGIEDTTLDQTNCALVTQRIFFADKLVEDTTVVVGTVSQARFAALAQQVGAELDPTRGHVLARIDDCEDEAAEFAAIDFSAGDGGAVKFIVDGANFTTGTDTAIAGLAGALNMQPAQEIAVSAYPDEIDLESSRGDVVTKQGELSYILLAPNSEVEVTPPTEPSEWTCVGSVSDPVVSEAEITVTVRVQASDAFAPNGIGIAGARVSVCLDETAACAVDGDAPLDPTREAETNATGSAQLTLSTDEAGFDGQLIITGTDPDCR